MKNKLYFAFIVAVLFALLTTSVSFAAGGNGKATPFKVTYEGPTHAECTGARVVQGNGLVKDSETCILSGDTSFFEVGTYVGNPDFCVRDVCGWIWYSDYDGTPAYNVTLTYFDNGDGTFTLDVVAYYDL